MSVSRTTYRAFSLVFRIPQIREQFGQVQDLIQLIYHTYTLWKVIQATILAEQAALGPVGWMMLGISAVGTAFAGYNLYQSLTPTDREQYRLGGNH